MTSSPEAIKSIPFLSAVHDLLLVRAEVLKSKQAQCSWCVQGAAVRALGAATSALLIILSDYANLI